MKKVYLDYNASTPLAPEVAAAMGPYLKADYGNPSSPHWAGSGAKAAIERARGKVAAFLGCSSREIVFTSGGTEASNLAIKGVFFEHWGQPFHAITSAIEHPATLGPCRFLEGLGASLTVLPVDGYGCVDPQQALDAITPHTRLVSIMHANNEVGTIQPIAEISGVLRERGILFHVDAAQSAGKVAVKVDELGADLLSITGQKLYGPKGVGALFARDGVRLTPLLHGPAAHESGRRAGTESALLATALGVACEVAEKRMPEDAPRLAALRDRFFEGLKAIFEDRIRLNGHPTRRLPNTLNVSLLDRPGSDVLSALDGVAASTGAACHSGSTALSPTLAAMGVSERWGQGAIRFSLGRESSLAEIDYVLDRMGALK